MMSEHDLLKRAMGLLFSFAKKATTRRYYEQAAGYPKDYGGDAELVHATNLLMARPEARKVIRELVTDAAQARKPKKI